MQTLISRLINNPKFRTGINYWISMGIGSGIIGSIYGFYFALKINQPKKKF